MIGDLRYYYSEQDGGLPFRTSFAKDAKVTFWSNLLCLLRNIYGSTCSAIVSVDETEFEILENASVPADSHHPRMQLANEFIAALRASPRTEKAVFKDHWVGLRLRHYEPWPAVFLVVDHDPENEFDVLDTTSLYRIEKIICDFLKIQQKYRRLRKGFKCQGNALRQAQSALRQRWE